MEQTLQVAAKSSGTVTGVAYWFTLGLYGDVTVSTGPAAYQGVCVCASFYVHTHTQTRTLFAVCFCVSYHHLIILYTVFVQILTLIFVLFTYLLAVFFICTNSLRQFLICCMFLFLCGEDSRISWLCYRLTLMLFLCIKISIHKKVYIFDESVLAPEFHYDFSTFSDDGTVFYRGPHAYHCPYAMAGSIMPWKSRNYENNIWLGTILWCSMVWYWPFISCWIGAHTWFS